MRWGYIIFPVITVAGPKHYLMRQSHFFGDDPMVIDGDDFFRRIDPCGGAVVMGHPNGNPFTERWVRAHVRWLNRVVSKPNQIAIPVCDEAA